jgi:hypothetical protein
MKITLEFNTDEASNVEALQNFFAAISGKSNTKAAPVLVAEEATEEIKFVPKKIKAANKATAKKEAEEAEEPEEAEAEKPEESNVKIEDVRKALGEVIASKGDTGREKAAAKLKAFGASNVSTLAPEHYEDFISFLEAL